MKRNAARFAFLFAALLLMPLAASVAEQVPLTPELAGVARQASAIDAGLAEAQVRTKLFTRAGQSGVLSYYTMKNTYSKLVVQLVSEQSGDVTEYYFDDGTLLYVMEACKNFSSPVKVGSLRDCKSVSEDRFYFTGGTLVGWMAGQGNGSLTLCPVRKGHEALARKGREVTRVARLWRAFADSPITDLLHFESSVSTTTPPLP